MTDTAKPYIAAPCSQSSSNFKRENGKYFCESCNKPVTDFRHCSPAYIAKAIGERKGSVCGIFYPHQLRRPDAPVHIHYTPYNWKVIFIAVALLPAISVYAGGSYHASQIIHKTRSMATRRSGSNKVQQDKTGYSITGRIFDKDSKKPCSYAHVSVQGTGVEAVADEDGMYQIDIPDSLANNPVVLVFTKRYYFSLQLTVNTQTSTRLKDMYLQKKPLSLRKKEAIIGECRF